ncbi:MAG: hypothetical protein V4502_01095 [Pseudomonadota bacterium]
MEHRTLKFERDEARRWTFKLLDDDDRPVLASMKSYNCFDDAVEDIRDLFRMADEI